MSSVLVRALLTVAEQRGVSRPQLLELAGIAPSCAEQVDGRVSLGQFQALLGHAIQLSGEPALGLHLGAHASEASFDLLGHMLPHAPNLRHAFAMYQRFQLLIADAGHLRLSERAGSARLACAMPAGHPPLELNIAEFALAALMRWLRAFGCTRQDVYGVSFEHARPAHASEHERIFGLVPRYSQRFNGVEFDRRVLDKRHLNQHPELYSLLRMHAEQKLERLIRPCTFVEYLHDVLRQQPCAGARPPDMEQVARDMGQSVRSLRRRLAEEGCSYRELTQAALEARACALLRDPQLTLQEVAHALGFDDPTSFHRAFKRRTGETPAQYREHALGTAPKRAEPLKQ